MERVISLPLCLHLYSVYILIVSTIRWISTGFSHISFDLITLFVTQLKFHTDQLDLHSCQMSSSQRCTVLTVEMELIVTIVIARGEQVSIRCTGLEQVLWRKLDVIMDFLSLRSSILRLKKWYRQDRWIKVDDEKRVKYGWFATNIMLHT